jgi:23S rRNA (adenine2503-C2)-methyltransferase
MPATQDIKDLTFEDLKAWLQDSGEPAFRAVQIFDWIYKRLKTEFSDFTNLPPALRRKLAAAFVSGRLAPVREFRSSDGTEKILWRLRDGEFIETVLIPAGARRTLCLSTQVGCKFGCSFCASGLPGFKRNLSPAEITGQILELKRGRNEEPTNIVFMGMGEPLDNLDNLIKAVRIMNAPEGMGMAARRMTISTCGLVPGIERLAKFDLQINLSLSLHAANNALRDRLMPVNRRYPLDTVVAACETYLASGGRMITLEYVLIKGINDGLHDADGLAGIARRLRAKVNLIAYSPVPQFPFETPSDPAVRQFARWLEERKVNVTIRLSKGKDIAAACGQLAGGFGSGAPGRRF